jgi:hypothetical protein
MRYALCDFISAMLYACLPQAGALLYALRKWRRIGWKNVCKLWLQERTPEQLKGEGDFVIFEWCFLLDPVQTLGTV